MRRAVAPARTRSRQRLCMYACMCLCAVCAVVFMTLAVPVATAACTQRGCPPLQAACSASGHLVCSLRAPVAPPGASCLPPALCTNTLVQLDVLRTGIRESCVRHWRGWWLSAGMGFPLMNSHFPPDSLLPRAFLARVGGLGPLSPCHPLHLSNRLHTTTARIHRGGRRMRRRRRPRRNAERCRGVPRSSGLLRKCKRRSGALHPGPTPAAPSRPCSTMGGHGGRRYGCTGPARPPDSGG
jgi:hypothetical protein